MIILAGVVLAGAGATYIAAKNGWFGGGAAIPEDTMTRGLVGSWSFDEGKGQVAYDASGSGNNGTLGSSAIADSSDPLWTNGKNAGALQFDGNNDYVTIPSPSFGSTFTIEFWTYVNPSGTRRNILDQMGTGENNDYSISCEIYSDNKFRFDTTTDGTTATLGRIYSDVAASKGWYHVVLWADGTTVKVYLNSVAQTTTLTRAVYDSSGNFILGKYGVYNLRYYNGLIDDVRIYNRALTEAEVKYHYNQGGPVGYWRFDEGSGLKARDESGNNNDGTLNGFNSTDSGTAEAGAGTTLTDNDKAWTVNQWTNGTIAITAGTGSGQTRTIASNTATVITVSSAWTTNPDATSVYSLTQASAWTDGKYGGAIQFDGKDDWINAGNGSSLNITKTLTLETWIKRADLSTDRYKGIILKEHVGGYALSLNYAAGDHKISFIAPTIGNRNMSTPIMDTNWHHIVCTVDENSNTLKFYIDGKIDSTQTTIGVLGANTDPLYFGYRTNYFSGAIDETKIYNYARTADEIRLDYQAGMATHLGPSGKTCAQDPASCMDKGLVGYWNMDEGGGTLAKDKSGNGNNGTLTNGPKWASGKNGGALKFDGKDDYVLIPYSSKLDGSFNDSDWSFSVWLRPSSNSNATGIRNIFEGRFHKPSIRMSSPGIIVLNGNVGGVFRTICSLSQAITNETWSYLTITANSTSITMYINGKPITTCSSQTIDWPPSDFRLGGRTDEQYKGLIDDMRIYNRALSAEEVRYHYNQGGPVGYWKLDEGSGLKARDESGNNNDGTLNGFNSTDSGTAEAGAGTTLTDNDKAWLVNQWINGTITITAGTGSGQSRTIASNTATVITVSSAWTTNPDATSVYSLTQASAWTDGKYGGAIQFDGKDDYVSVGNTASIASAFQGPGTVSLWLKPNMNYNDGANHSLFYYSNITYFNLYKDWNQNKLTVNVGGSQTLQTQKVVNWSQNWYHIVVNWENIGTSNTIARLYVNGVLLSSSVGITTIPSVGSFIVGKGYGNTNGAIDDVRIYSYVRSADDIRMDYQAGMASHFGPSGQTCSADPASCMDKGLVGYWPMDEGGGTVAKDKSGNGNNGTLTNGPKWASGKKGGALQFDGKNDYVSCAANSIFDITQSVTIAAWIKPENIAGYRYIAGKSYRWPYGLYSTLGKLTIGLTWNDDTFAYYSGPNSSITNKQWQYVAVVRNYDTGEIKYYINGINTDTLTGYNKLMKVAAYNISIGSPATEQYFNGLIDDVRIYNRALSAEEVRYHYNQGEPVAHWAMDEGKGTKAFDDSGNNNKGILGDGTCQPGAGTCPSWVAGKIGSALSFDGSNDYVDGGGSDNIDSITGDLTLESWVYMNQSRDAEIISTRYGKDDFTRPYSLFISDTTNRASIRLGNGASQFVATSGNLNLSTWYHLTGTVLGNNIVMYVNGIKTGTATFTGTRQLGGKVTLGSGALGTSRNFYGLMDDARIYNYARTADQIKTDYNAGVATHLK